VTPPSTAGAQGRAPRIWDVALGSHVASLPTDEFVDPACGTNGGPAGLALGRFEDFARCPVEPSGLREAWFIYDDTAEHVALARRLLNVTSATVVLNQPVILSLLIGEDARVRGIRVISDPRADPILRVEAHALALAFKARYRVAAGDCVDLPLAAGETPIEGVHVKQRCAREADGRQVVIEARYFHKPGQQFTDPLHPPSANDFESSARLEVVQARPWSNIGPDPVPRPAAAAMGDARARFLAGAIADCPGCDLSDVDLRRRDLARADLSGAKLDGASLHRANLRGANLAGASLAGANLNRANLSFANLAGARLNQAMLHLVEAGRVDLTGADLTGALMGRAQLNGVFAPAASFARADLSGVQAVAIHMPEAGLRGARLDGAVLRGGDLYKADLTEASIEGADFREARLLSARLPDSRARATFTGALMPDNTIQR
jgi:uncharacterized protein YjbI with pentapeptide repeats